VSDEAIILLAEDRDDDIALIKRAFQQACLSNPIYVVKDGEQAIEYLRGNGPFANREEFPLPDLLLLDLKMPRCDGFEVLQWIRNEPGLSSLRVIVLTSSISMADVNRAYQLGANSFLVKPLEFEQFVEVSKNFTRYWLNLDKRPTVSRLSGVAKKTVRVEEEKRD